MMEVRLRSKIGKQELGEKIGKILTDADYNFLLTGRARVLKPDGSPLCVYLPGQLPTDLLDASYDTLHSLKKYETRNRGKASGTIRVRERRESRTYTKPVASAIIGAFDPMSPYTYCRLTAWTGAETEKFRELFPLFQAIAGAFKEHVPERYAVQMGEAEKTDPAWAIEGTPFTTITCHNSYATGVHQDKGDLDAGFSCLAVLRKGDYTGGRLTFPEWRVSVDMGHGDVLLMNAHDWHGNTAMTLESPDAERISVVCYFRTKMTTCDTPEAEAKKAALRNPATREVAGEATNA